MRTKSGSGSQEKKFNHQDLYDEVFTGWISGKGERYRKTAFRRLPAKLDLVFSPCPRSAKLSRKSCTPVPGTGDLIQLNFRRHTAIECNKAAIRLH